MTAPKTRITSWDAYIDRLLADVEADLGDDETMQSLGLHGRVRLHERRAVLQDIRQQLDYTDAELQRAKGARP